MTDLINELRSAGGPLLTVGPFRLSLNNLLEESGTIIRGLLSMISASPAPILRGVTAGVVSVVYTLVLSYWLLKDLNNCNALCSISACRLSGRDATFGGELNDISEHFMGVTLGIVHCCRPFAYDCRYANAGGLALLAAVVELLPSIGPASVVRLAPGALFQAQTALIGHLGFTVCGCDL